MMFPSVWLSIKELCKTFHLSASFVTTPVHMVRAALGAGRKSKRRVMKHAHFAQPLCVFQHHRLQLGLQVLNSHQHVLHNQRQGEDPVPTIAIRGKSSNRKCHQAKEHWRVPNDGSDLYLLIYHRFWVVWKALCFEYQWLWKYENSFTGVECQRQVFG